MKDNSVNTNVKTKMKNTNRRTVLILSILLALSLVSTIVLASFQAQRNSTAQLGFANGVTLQLTKTGTSGATTSTITNESSGSATATFNYTTKSGLKANVVLDGISCKVLNQAAYIAYSVQVLDSSTAVKGSWATFDDDNAAIFTPTSGDWRAKVTVPASTWTGTATSSATTQFRVLQTSTSAIAANASIVLFTKVELYGSSTAADVTALAGKTMKFSFKLSAHTTARNTNLV